jgi:ATP-dependent exoDNAse (exonuclease V) beta subunit
MPDRLPDHAERLLAESAIERSLAVEAAAGTGKTTLLVRRLLHVLAFAEVDGRPVRIDEVVAITFTDKAAGELKSRLRDALERAIVDGQLGDRPLPPGPRTRLRDALHGLDAAVIGTIHSFCGTLVRERPVEASVDPERRVADPLTQSLLLDEAWDTWCDQVLHSHDDAGITGALAAELAVESPSARSFGTNSMRNLAIILVENRELLDLLPPVIPTAHLLNEFRADLAAEQPRLIQLARDCRQWASIKHHDRALRDLCQFIGLPDLLAQADEAAVVEILMKLECPCKEGGGKTKWKSPESLAAAKEAAMRWWNRTRAVVTHEPLARLAQALRGFVEHYERLKAERAIFDFQDMLLMARRLLQSSAEVRSYFRHRYRFLLVDEFQDTDPLQADVIRLLTDPGDTGAEASAMPARPQTREPRSADRPGIEPGRLFLVGDPKQSIYRFRRADIETYERVVRRLESAESQPAKRRGRPRHAADRAARRDSDRAVDPASAGQSRVTISCNFRSGRRIIDAANRIFGQLIAPSTDGYYQPAYVPLIAGPRAAEPPGGQVFLLYPPEPLGGGRGGDLADDRLLAEEVRFREGVIIARFIQQAVREQWLVAERAGPPRPIDYRDVAILCERMTGIDQYEDAFRACGLPYQIVGGKHYYRRMEVQSLQAALEAIDDPENMVALVAALRSPIFGVSDQTLWSQVSGRRYLHYLDPAGDRLRHGRRAGDLGPHLDKDTRAGDSTRAPAARDRNRPEAAGAPRQLLLGFGSGPVEVAEDEVVAPLVEPFQLLRSLHARRNSQSVERTVRQLFEATKALEMFSLLPQGEQRVANLLKVLNTARSLEATGLLTFRRFVRWLRERVLAEEEESESPTAEPGDPVVQVLTIHKSKGLEFRMTVLAGFSSGAPHAVSGLVVDRARGRLEMKVGKLQTLGWHEAEQWESVRQDAERRRVFYVAATRARDYLVLPVFWPTQLKKQGQNGPQGMQAYLEGALPDPALVPWGERLSSGLLQDAIAFDTRGYLPWPAVPQAPALDFRRSATEAETERGEAFRRQREDFARELDHVTARAAVGRAVRHPSQHAGPPPGPAEPAADAARRAPVSTRSRAAALGSAVHELLAICFSAPATPSDLDAAAHATAARYELDDAQTAELLSLVRSTLDAPLGRRLRRAGRLFAEVPFCHCTGGEWIEGNIDIVAEEPAGLLVVDFKTDRVSPAETAARAEIYAAQLRDYVLALEAVTPGRVHEAVLYFVRSGVACPVLF